MEKKKVKFMAAFMTAALCSTSFTAFAYAAKKETREENSTEEYTGVITDHAGNEIELPKEINRIVVTDALPLPSVLSLYLDSAEKIVGISPVSMSAAKAGLLGELYPEILKADTSFYENSELNIESLLALEPDIVFYNATSKELGESLESAGLTAIAVSVTNWDYNAADTFDAWMELLADIFPEEKDKAEAAKKYCEDVEESIIKATKELKKKDKKDVFFLFNYSDTALVTSGKNFWGQYWCDAVNAVNVAEEVEAQRSSASVNMEQIYSWNPEIIFITNFTKAMPEDLYDNTIGDDDWSSISAIENRNVYKMPLGAYRSFTPGADTPMTLMWMAKMVYPELFEDIDMTEEVYDYYKEVYDIELTTKQIEQMYTPSEEAADGYGKKK